MENKTETFILFFYLLLSESQQLGKAPDSALKPKSTQSSDSDATDLPAPGKRPSGSVAPTHPQAWKFCGFCHVPKAHFYYRERCQLLTARDEKQMWKISEYIPMKSDGGKK